MKHSVQRMRKKRKTAVLLVLSFCFFVFILASSSVLAQEQEELEKEITFGLTGEEAEYLGTLAGRTLTLGVADNSAFDHDSNGNAIGTAVPLLQFLEYELDLETEIVKDDWEVVYAKAVSGEIDFLFDVPNEEQTRKNLTISEAVYEDPVFRPSDAKGFIATGKEELKPLIGIFNRFLTQTEEGDAFITQVNDERQRYDIEIFFRDDKETIEYVKKTYGTVKWYPGDGKNLPVSYEEDGEYKGIVPEMMQFFHDISGIDFEVVSAIPSAAEVEDALESGNLQIATGVVKNQKNEDRFSFSEDIYESRLIVVGDIYGEDPGISHVDQYFWGVLDSVEPLLLGSNFEGRMIPYSNLEDIVEAIENGDIKGAVIKQGMLDYCNLITKNKSLRRMTKISVPYSESLTIASKDKRLTELVGKMVGHYRAYHSDYMERWHDTKVNYQDEIVNYYYRESNLKSKLMLAAIILILAMITIVTVVLITTKSLKRLNIKLKTLTQSNDKLDIQEIDLSKGRISSSSGFRIFGLEKPLESKVDNKDSLASAEVSMSELKEETGFDFEKHYEAICSRDRDSFEMEYEIENENRTIFIREIGNRTGKYIVSALFDISKEKEENKQWKKRAEFDPLTGLYNRSSFERRICEIVEWYPENFGVFAFVDMNKFKTINDTYGHAVGDDILLSFAGSLQKLMDKDENDTTIAFRFGGDEFGIFKGNIKDDAELSKFLDELLSLKMAAEFNGEYITTTYSLGVSIYNKDAVALADLMEYADQAMYECKENDYAMVVYQDKKVEREDTK